VSAKQTGEDVCLSCVSYKPLNINFFNSLQHSLISHETDTSFWCAAPRAKLCSWKNQKPWKL